MKIYHIALQAEGEPNQAITRSMQARGHEVREFNWVTEIRRGVKVMHRTILEQVKVFKPDLIFMQLQSDKVLDQANAKALTAQAFTVNWTGDVRSNIEWYNTLGKDINLTLFSNYTDVLKCREVIPVDYLQVGFDERIYKPMPSEKSDAVVFMGNNYAHNPFPLCGHRRQMVQHLQKTVTNFQVYGIGWKGSKAVKPDQEVKIYRSSLAAINQNHFDYELFSSDRILRIMGSGCLCLTRYYKGLETEYEIGTHLLAWSTFDELTVLIEWVRANPAKAAEIAENGCAHVHANCTWVNRIEQLEKLYQQYK